VPDTTKWLIAALTKVLHTCKTAEVKFEPIGHLAEQRKVGIVSTLQTWINQSSTKTNLDVVSPIKARACDALNAVLRNRPRQSATDSRVMRKGIERC
jgi:hypothetical protein